MNKKGFTIIELMAVLLILGLVASITVYSISSIFKSTKEKTEDVFVETIKDSLDMYLSSNAKSLTGWSTCSNALKKTHGNVSVSYANIHFSSVINSDYKPITEDDIVNPANEDVTCNKNIPVTIYKDKDNVYYYSFKKEDFGCLINVGTVTNLPEGFTC